MIDGLCAHIRDIKSPEALKSAFETLGKVLVTPAFNKTQRAKLIAAFLRAQASLGVSVIPLNQGLLAVLPIERPVALTAHDKDALLQRIATADLEGLETMRQQVLTTLTLPHFPAGDHKAVLQHIDLRLMTLRASA